MDHMVILYAVIGTIELIMAMGLVLAHSIPLGDDP